MNYKDSEFQIENESIRQEVIPISSYETSEALKCGIRKLITSYKEKGWILISIISNKFVIYLQFKKYIFQV